MTNQLTVVVIAQNEEANIAFCLNSVKDWAREALVIDSFSEDSTVALSRSLGARVEAHRFEDWASQRNWALDTAAIDTEWVLFLDADEQATEAFKREVDRALAEDSAEVTAYCVRFDFYFLRRMLRHGYESPPVIRLIRRGKVRWRGAGAREYCPVQGVLGEITSRLRHEDHKGISEWIEKQNRNTSREARWLMARRKESSSNSQSSERRFRLWLREKVWVRMPLFVRSLFYFCYRYIWRGAFLDGKAGLVYTFLQGFWYSFLVDTKYYELLLLETEPDHPIPDQTKDKATSNAV